MSNYVVSGRRLRGLVVLLLMVGFLSFSFGESASAQGPDDQPLLRQPAVDGPSSERGKSAAGVPSGELPVALPGSQGEAPVVSAPSKGEVIPGQYIVVFHPRTANSADLARTLVDAQGGALLATYEHALQGFAARLSPQAVEALRNNPNVAYVEADQVVTVADTQSNATWGLDRSDQRDLPLNGSYTYTPTGSGVNAYIIDTGIRLSHSEFGGRAVTGYDAVTSGGSASDCNGHGTHVAGTVGGSTYGVAKQVRLYAVRVLDCNGSGSLSGVIAGVDWVTANHVKPAVANMSLGGSASSSLDDAVNNSIAAGITYAIAAGNSSADACNYSPARVAAALTVGATTSSDARSSFSNYGTCLDLFAPGSSITSAWHTGDTDTNTISGTSMAAPHVAGVAALYLHNDTGASPTTVRDAIVNSASTNRLSDVGSGSPNLLLYSLLESSSTTPPPSTDGNVLVNPGFESGPNAGWLEYSSAGYTLVTTDRPRTGSWSAWLGGYNRATDYIYQQVTVPTDGLLTYAWRVETNETSNRVYDYMEVRLYDGASGSYITTLRRWSNASLKNTWSEDTLNLSSYAGRSVYVMFYAKTDKSRPTSFFVDDTGLQ